jgi:ferrous iron transport protein A
MADDLRFVGPAATVLVEGARIEVIHEGVIRHDPIAVRLDDMRVALRRRDAEDVFILLDGARAAAQS